MKAKVLFLIVILFGLLSSCALFKDQSSRFTDVKLGMEKEAFIAKYGKPLQYNFFNNEEGVFCEELIYKEVIYYVLEPRMINSIFFFEGGRLVSQEQMEDWVYREEKMREKEMEKIYGGGN
ncbi:hypothetical protein [Petrimonas sp.]|uniref:hypothetical protein n=1 Tax=Petrimonas sp. TaxID=2023866 RepID=UPI003F50F2BF